jgi:hypothetical protein
MSDVTPERTWTKEEGRTPMTAPSGTGSRAGEHGRGRIVASAALALCLVSTLGCTKDLSGTYQVDLIEVQGTTKLQRPSTVTVRNDGDKHTVTISGDSFIAQSGCAVEVDQVGEILLKEDRMGLSQCNSKELRLYLDVTVVAVDTTGPATEFELRGNMYTNADHTFDPVPYRLVTRGFDIER